jgi:hypothetical protein
LCKCLLQYFKTIATSSNLEGNIIFERKVLRDFPDWSSSTKPIKRISIDDKAKIEDTNVAFHADFANSFISGDVLQGTELSCDFHTFMAL